MSTIHNLVSRIRAEYLEMPGMKLTIQQLQRLCGVEHAPCQRVIDALVDARFLCVKADGSYTRLTDGEVPRPRPAKTDLGVEERVEVAS